MKLFAPILLSVLFVSCGQMDARFELPHLNGNSKIDDGKPKDEPSRWIPRKELLDYIKNAPKIKRTEGIVSPFDTLDYNQIIAYKFWNSGEHNPKVYREIVVKDNVHYGSLVTEIEKQLALNQDQADRILRFLNKRSTYGGIRAACYEPRFGLVFYKDGNVVTQINICMECNYLKSDVLIPAYEQQKTRSENVSDEKFRAKDDFGFSKKGYKALEEFHKEFGFQEE